MSEITTRNAGFAIAFLAVLGAALLLATAALVSWIIEGDPNPIFIGAFLLAATANLLVSLVLKLMTRNRRDVRNG